jgi:sporulation protein YlmC with PRC-barrel domain
MLVGKGDGAAVGFLPDVVLVIESGEGSGFRVRGDAAYEGKARRFP